MTGVLRWLETPACLAPAGRDPVAWSRRFSRLEASAPEAERVAIRLVERLMSEVPSDPVERHPLLATLRHALDAAGDGERSVGVPPRIWERLLAALGAVRVPSAGVPDPESPELPEIGARRGRWTEWWALADHPGGRYGTDLWGWGATTEEAGPARFDELGALTPRRAWGWSDGWRLHPVLELRRARGTLPIPSTPGALGAALVDAVATVAREAGLKDRDRAMTWAAGLGPLLALSATIRAPRPSPADLVPDYQALWAFHLLHPRLQEVLVLLDELASALAAGDSAVFLAAGVDEDDPHAAARAVLARVEACLFTRGAHLGWDSGFGYTLVRKVVAEYREALDADPDAVLHARSAPDSDLGALGTRLRAALKVALSFPGEAGDRYARGPAAEQLADLAWLGWTDPDLPR